MAFLTHKIIKQLYSMFSDDSVATEFIERLKGTFYVYPTLADLPAQVNEPTLALVQETNSYYSFNMDTGIWEGIGGAGGFLPVLDYVDNTLPPPTSNLGDRYILDNTVGGVNPAWGLALINDVVEYNGITWDATTPQNGNQVFVINLTYEMTFVTLPTNHWIESGAPATTYVQPIPSGKSWGNYPIGTTFPAPVTLQQLVDGALQVELFPTLTNPSSNLTLTETGLHEIGEIIATLHFNATFNRGSISPAYGTSGLRSGLPNNYNYTGTGLPANFPSTSLTDVQTVSSYTVLSGIQTWSGTVSYDIGEQPLSSWGNPYSTPLPAGTSGSHLVTITGVYPYFATTASILTLTQQPLALMTSTYVQTDVVAEDDFSNKQTVDFPNAWSSITGVQFYNTVSSTWEWINGTKANSLLTFTQTVTTHTVQGNLINYKRYTHNGAKIGARQLRWYTN